MPHVASRGRIRRMALFTSCVASDGPVSSAAISALPQPRIGAAWRRSIPQMVGIGVLLALLAFVIFGPLANLFLWAFAEKWYFPNKLPQEFGLTFWGRVF